jgi:recombinational DNA repair protein RecR
MAKTLCKRKKSKKVSVQQSLELYPEATHICDKCGRVANKKKRLCKPRRLRSR